MVRHMRQIGKIKCIEVSPSTPGESTLVLLFHGFGADAYDLQTLSDVMTPKHPHHWLFPQGPLEVPIGPGWTGRAWWNIDMMEIQAAAEKGQHRDMTNVHPPELPKLRTQIFEMVEKLNVPWSRIVLGGFSQGAMLATDLYLHAPESAKGLMIFSGQLLCKETWKPLVPKRAGKKFFMSHGTQDPILSFVGAQRLETLLTQNGMKGRLLSFPGAHEIPMQAISAATEYLNSISE